MWELTGNVQVYWVFVKDTIKIWLKLANRMVQWYIGSYFSHAYCTTGETREQGAPD